MDVALLDHGDVQSDPFDRSLTPRRLFAYFCPNAFAAKSTAERPRPSSSHRGERASASDQYNMIFASARPVVLAFVACLVWVRSEALGNDRAWLGLDICDNPHQTSSDARTVGIVVLLVQPDSPAYIAGVRVQDVIIRLDEQSVSSAADFVCMIATRSPGNIARLLVIRGNEQQVASVTLGRWPDDLRLTPGQCALGVA